MRRLAILIVAVITGTSPAFSDELDAAIDDFLDAPGFERLDAMALEESLYEHWLQTSSVTPAGGVGPIEKALLIATSAIPSSRTRTAIEYGQMLWDDMGVPYPVSFITLRHYNLGPAIRAEAAAAYGAENVAPPEEFGTGDHMEWRFVFSPVMGNAAMLMDASAGTIPEKQAYQHDCTGRPCLDTGASFEDLAPWEDISGELPGWPPLYPATADGVATPAHAAAELATLGFWANAEAGQYQWTGGEHPEGARGTEPFRFIGIDRDLAQDAMIDAVWHETALNDDAVTALYFRRAEVAGWVSYMRAAEGR